MSGRPAESYLHGSTGERSAIDHKSKTHCTSPSEVLGIPLLPSLSQLWRKVLLLFWGCCCCCYRQFCFLHFISGSQKTVLDPLELELQAVVKPPFGFWEPSLGPLQEHRVLLTVQPTLQVGVLMPPLLAV